MNPMLDELKRPATALWVIGIIISIITAVYFYKKSEKFGQISMDMEQIQVFDKTRGGVVPLTVLDSAGRAIENNVYAASLTIWNSGNAEVKKEDVREPIRLAVEMEGGDNSSKTLDISPYFYTRNNIDGFSANPNTGEISWQHFDAGEGLKVKLVYVSSTPKWIALIGYVAGSEIINPQQLAAQHSDLNKTSTNILLAGTVVAILFSLVSFILMRGAAINAVMVMNVMSMGMSAGVLVTLYYWGWGLSRPPF
jgi:hypothetical protein